MNFILAIAFSFVAMQSYAGVTNGGGGKSVVCRDVAGKITKAEVLDLFEAREVYGLTPNISAGNLQDILALVKNKLKFTMHQPEIHVFPLIDRVQKNFKLISE